MVSVGPVGGATSMVLPVDSTLEVSVPHGGHSLLSVRGGVAALSSMSGTSIVGSSGWSSLEEVVSVVCPGKSGDLVCVVVTCMVSAMGSVSSSYNPLEGASIPPVGMVDLLSGSCIVVVTVSYNTLEGSVAVALPVHVMCCCIVGASVVSALGSVELSGVASVRSPSCWSPMLGPSNGSAASVVGATARAVSV